MTLEEFYQHIDNQELCQNYLVRIKMKYSHESEYDLLNELYLFNGEECKYEWLYDWYEGQQEVEVIGFIPVSDIQIKQKATWLPASDTLRCSNCGFGYFPTDYYFDKGRCISAGTDRFIFKVCPICGTQMEGQE